MNFAIQEGREWINFMIEISVLIFFYTDLLKLSNWLDVFVFYVSSQTICFLNNYINLHAYNSTQLIQELYLDFLHENFE